jgi:hypothetical protein
MLVIKKLGMFQVWGQVADVMHVIKVAVFLCQAAWNILFFWRRAYKSGRLLLAIGETS